MLSNNKIKDYSIKVFELWKKSNIILPRNAIVNIYHHLGINELSKVGATFMNTVNMDYSLSFVSMIPRQMYPMHYHRIKRESFYVLYGDLIVNLDDEEYVLKEGDMLNIERGQYHSFKTFGGVVFEEISTEYVPNDSIYSLIDIQKTLYSERRTTLKMNDWEELVTNEKR